jgi:hypothetical protein
MFTRTLRYSARLVAALRAKKQQARSHQVSAANESAHVVPFRCRLSARRSAPETSHHPSRFFPLVRYVHLPCNEKPHIRITGSNLQHGCEAEFLHQFRNETRSGHEAETSFGLQVMEDC